MADEEKRSEGENEATPEGQVTETHQAADDGLTDEVAGKREDSAPLEATLPAPGDPAAAGSKTEEAAETKGAEPRDPELHGSAGVHAHTEPPAEARLAAASKKSAAAAHADHGGDDHGHHGHGHVAPMSMLLGVLGALIILTVMTVAVTAVDLGSQGNFVVAMIIATVKAALVMGYFMHLVWDSKFNVLVFLSSFLFVLLFLSMALLDRQEYQENIDEFEQTQAQVQAG